MKRSRASLSTEDASEFIPMGGRSGPNKRKKEYIDLVRERTDGRKHLDYLGPDGLVLKECKYIGG